MRIALFATCLADAMFPPAAIATVQVLERLGHQVMFPQDQTCCGQMHVNTGYLREATALVRNHVAALRIRELRRRCRAVRVMCRFRASPACDGGPSGR